MRLVRAYKVLAFADALAIIPLFLLQAIVLRAFCTYCLATETIMLSMWVVSSAARDAPRPPAGAERLGRARDAPFACVLYKSIVWYAK